MVSIRKITLGLLLAAAFSSLVMAGLFLWNYRLWQQASSPAAVAVSPDDRARILQDRIEVLSKRVNDMELLVLILLGTSGLYSIVFVASSYISSMSFARQADRSIAAIKEQIGIAAAKPCPDETKPGELHYNLACASAAAHDYDRAVKELALSFQHQSRKLNERLANDIEEGGALYALASTPPYDKAVNDILLNVLL